MKRVMNLTEEQLLEVQGFLDLGFDIANPERLNPRVMELIPGLKLLQFQQQQKKGNDGEGVDVAADRLLKDYLREWARSVACKAVSGGAS